MNNNRPLSPHLQVYKLPLTGIISITHRMTGVFLSLGLVFVIWMLQGIASGESAFLQIQSVLHYPLVQLILWGFIYALFFHLCHGIRHLIWDAGYSFNRETMDKYAIFELLASVVLTATVFFVFF